ncbi:MAG: PEGA domain-containing protein, partial [Myxococcales bacterium]|nr:PEGA domain-containing protein [Myxococcales bacterium]
MSRLPRLILLASLTGVFALDARAQGPEPQPDTSEAPEPPPDPNKVRAKQLFEQGAQAYAQKHYKDAIDLFLSADRLVQSPAFPYNIAKAYREMGDTANALRWAREYLRRSPEAANRDEVEGDISRYEVRLAEKGVMQLTVRSSPSGATVLINGEPVGVTPWTGERVPGAINVLLRLRGYEERAQTLDLGAEHTLDVTVPLEAESATPPPPSPTPTPTPTPTP